MAAVKAPDLDSAQKKKSSTSVSNSSQHNFQYHKDKFFLTYGILSPCTDKSQSLFITMKPHPVIYKTPLNISPPTW